MLTRINKNLAIYKNEFREKGLSYIIIARIEKITDLLDFYYKTIFLSKRTFTFQSRTYYYFYHPYNYTWKNERAIEIPIIWDIIRKNPNKKVLEVGNVLSHYYQVHHTILDKYEKGDNVINEDVIDFNPKKKYDLIVSISTLEHVGWDEEPREPLKILAAVKNLKKLLKRNGKIIISLPLGHYNPKLNQLIFKNKIPFSEKYYLKRISSDNCWMQINRNELKSIKYNSKYPNANAIVVGKIK